MTPEQIREVVKITLDELALNKMLSDPYQRILSIVERELRAYFNNKRDTVLPALRELSEDEYIDIIYLQYRDGKTIEFIAEYYDKDTSTILRNKKRLIKTIYEIIREC